MTPIYMKIIINNDFRDLRATHEVTAATRCERVTPEPAASPLDLKSISPTLLPILNSAFYYQTMRVFFFSEQLF